MAAELDKPQLYTETDLDPKIFKTPTHLMEILLPWAKTCPPPGTVIDLAAGLGTEVLALEQAGIPVIGQEGGEYIHAVTTLQKGLAEKLDQYPDHSFGGAFLKDTWLLLSPSQRREMLTGLKRILQPQGSLLLISEIISEYHARGSKTGEIVAHDYPSWRAGVSLIQSNEGLETINYLSTPEDTRCTAEENGYEFTLIREYPKTDPLARENRWTPGDGFIAKLTPKTGEE